MCDLLEHWSKDVIIEAYSQKYEVNKESLLVLPPNICLIRSFQKKVGLSNDFIEHELAHGAVCEKYEIPHAYIFYLKDNIPVCEVFFIDMPDKYSDIERENISIEIGLAPKDPSPKDLKIVELAKKRLVELKS